MKTYTLRLDERGREVLLRSLRIVKTAAEEDIVDGNFSETSLKAHEELLQLHRGILYVRPDAEPEVEEPVVGPDAGINQHHSLDTLPN